MGDEEALSELRERQAVLEEVESLQARARAARDASIVRAYREGVHVKAIAEVVKHSLPTVYNIINSGGAPPTPRRARGGGRGLSGGGRYDTSEEDGLTEEQAYWSRYWRDPIHRTEGVKERLGPTPQLGPNAKAVYGSGVGGWMSWEVFDDSQDFLMSVSDWLAAHTEGES